MTKEEMKQVEYMAGTLCLEYGEGCQHCSSSNPDAECPCTIEEDCRRLADSGFRMERYSSWSFDEYEDCVVCACCYGKPLANPEALSDPGVSDNIVLSEYCPHCGAKMNMTPSQE